VDAGVLDASRGEQILHGAAPCRWNEGQKAPLVEDVVGALVRERLTETKLTGRERGSTNINIATDWTRERCPPGSSAQRKSSAAAARCGKRSKASDLAREAVGRHARVGQLGMPVVRRLDIDITVLASSLLS
jgi:hypothetical protein